MFKVLGFFLRVRWCLVGDITLDRYTAQFRDIFLGTEDGVQDLELGGQDSIQGLCSGDSHGSMGIA